MSSGVQVEGRTIFNNSVINDPDLTIGNLVYVAEGETIQSVIDSCDVGVGSLLEGYSNPYTIKVPPGHETEFYSLVRTAADAASDKRNVEVVFEDNPTGEFKVLMINDCTSVAGWTTGVDDTVTVDSDHGFDGGDCIKIESLAASGMVNVNWNNVAMDFRGYNGILIDIDAPQATLEQMTNTFRIHVYDGNGDYIRVNSPIGGSGTRSGPFKGTVFLPLVDLTGNGRTIDLSDIDYIVFYLTRDVTWTDPITVYIDNIRLIRTFPYNVCVLRYDDDYLSHWDIAAKLLRERNWNGVFATHRPQNINSATRLNLKHLQAMDLAGHDIANHTVDHIHFDVENASVSHYNYYGMRQWMQRNGFHRASRIFINPNTSSNEHLEKYLNDDGVLCVSTTGRFPVGMIAAPEPDAGALSQEMEDFLAQKGGGLVQFMVHDISVEATHDGWFDWVEQNFSKVMTFSQVMEYFPPEMVPSIAGEMCVKPYGKEEILTADGTFGLWCGNTLNIDPGGASRALNPVGSFDQWHKVTIINIADAAEIITFEPTFTAAGAHDGANDADVLTDSGESWVTDQLVGKTINNTTDGSSGTITENTGTTITATLSGGTNDDWDTGDTYTITPTGANVAIAQNERGIFVFDGTNWKVVKAPNKYTTISHSPAAAATEDLDLSLSTIHDVTMPAGNITLTVSGEQNGQIFTVRILQDGTGSRTVTWFSTIKWAGGSAPTLTTTANKADMFVFRVTGTDTYDGFIVGQNI